MSFLGSSGFPVAGEGEPQEFSSKARTVENRIRANMVSLSVWAGSYVPSPRHTLMKTFFRYRIYRNVHSVATRVTAATNGFHAPDWLTTPRKKMFEMSVKLIWLCKT